MLLGFFSLSITDRLSLSGVPAQPHNRYTRLKVFVRVRVVCGHLVHHCQFIATGRNIGTVITQRWLHRGVCEKMFHHKCSKPQFQKWNFFVGNAAVSSYVSTSAPQRVEKLKKAAANLCSYM